MAERAQIAIVGAGVTGLAAACELGAGAFVVDRIPVCGGVTGWRHPIVGQLERRARAAGARLALGVTATRWEQGELLVIGPEGPLRIAADGLLVAAGSRPLGRAELGLAGARPAGVMPATVACHLAESGLAAGRRPIVLGGGDWAERATRELLAAGARSVSVVAPEGVLRAFPGSAAVHVHAHVQPLAIEGGPRVTGLRTDAGTIEGDALVLAHRLAPLRNVDGAVDAGENTVYAQPESDPASVSAAIAAGRAAAASMLQRAAA